MQTRLLFVVALLTAASSAQSLRNPNFEETDKNTGAITGWYTPQNVGWTPTKFYSSRCHAGLGCVQLSPGAGERSNIMQYFDAAPFRGRLVRMRGWFRMEDAARAQMWLRVDLPDSKMGFFDNMQDRPVIGATEWRAVEITGTVAANAKGIALGAMAFNGTVWFDDVSFDIIGDAPPPAAVEPARPLSEAGLRNLTTFAEIYGLVRYYHPSDEVAAADMDRFAIDALPAIEAADTPQKLASALRAAFAPVAPTLRIWSAADEPPAASASLQPSPEAKYVIGWKHHGVGLTKPSAYASSREKSESTTETKLEMVERTFPRSEIKVSIPIRLFTDARGATLPHGDKAQAAPVLEYSAASRTTRLADIVITWNVMEHFYPYFDVVKTDWREVLPAALKRAAVDKDELAFEKTLQWTVAQLHDGHGNAFWTGSGRPVQMLAPFLVDWIDGKVIVTKVLPTAAEGLKPGDEVVSLNGRPAAQVLADLEQYISGATPQWIRTKSLGQYFCLGDKDAAGKVEIRSPGQAQIKTVDFRYASQHQTLIDSRPVDSVTELKPGIWYVDLTRATDKDFDGALPKLAKATGIVFDIRGYPKVTPVWLQHVSKTPLHSAQWHIADSTRPGEHVFGQSGWPIEPKAPYLAGKKIFLTHGGAISYAETTMGIIEHYKLGEILGSATAGTNGNINNLTLPGKYRVIFTGMKVLKHDGTRHHGIGINPTVPVTRTQAGVAAGKDEVIEEAIRRLE